MLENKVVVVIGGTKGLGLSAANACAVAGARVVIVGRQDDSLEAALAGFPADTATGIAADAADPATAIQAIDLALKRFGGFDGLYHVAGGSGRRRGDGPLHEIPDEAWRYTFDLNVTSLFNSNRAATRQFLKQKTRGSILNIGSVLGSSPSPRYFATHAYTAAKSAIIGFTKSCASYYTRDNIRFNMVVPALVETPMAARAANDAEIQAFIRTKQPLDGGRIGQPQDLDAAVVYFLSDQSAFTTGQILTIDGGWCVSEGQYADE